MSIKSKNDEKLYKDRVKNKLCNDPKSAKLDPYEFKISLIDNVKPEELDAGAKVKYIRTIVHGEAYISLTRCPPRWELLPQSI